MSGWSSAVEVSRGTYHARGAEAKPLALTFSQSGMACPLCGEQCRCSYAAPANSGSTSSSLIDPDQPDRSEEQFAASLEAKAAVAEDEQTTALRRAISAAFEDIRNPRPSTGTVALRAAIADEMEAARNPRISTATQSLRTAIAAELDTLSSHDDGPRGQDDEAEWDFVSASAPQSHGAVMNEPEWKQEVASRLENYRSRRGSRRPRHEGSLSLDFERAMNRMPEEPAVSAQASDNSGYVANAVAPAFEDSAYGAATEPDAFAEQQFAPPEPASNVIKFPRPVSLFEPFAPPTGDELAEPMIDRPRIIEAPEEVHCADAPLAGIELEAEEAEALGDLELPLDVAPLSQRVFAAVLDGLVVAIGTAIFLLIVLYADVPAPQGKLAFVLVAALPALLWSIYEYLFLVHAGRTPGMQMARLAMTDFDGLPPARRVRRVRALATTLSLCSLGLGVMWALLDEDTLCWHDRISRTYMAQV